MRRSRWILAGLVLLFALQAVAVAEMQADGGHSVEVAKQHFR